MHGQSVTQLRPPRQDVFKAKRVTRGGLGRKREEDNGPNRDGQRARRPARDRRDYRSSSEVTPIREQFSRTTSRVQDGFVLVFEESETPFARHLSVLSAEAVVLRGRNTIVYRLTETNSRERTSGKRIKAFAFGETSCGVYSPALWTR